MHLNVLSQAVPSPLFEGLWRHPDDRSATGYRTMSHWTSVARKLEAACVDALFFADIHGVYDVYGGSAAASVRHAHQVPAIDPVLLLPALAAATEQLGFAVTYSTSYHAPYQCARVFSTLDHLTDGRVGWNIVTSDLRLAASTGLGTYIPHDERYDRADEYVEVVRALWERSWDAGAVRHDAAADVFTDPAAVRAVTHQGRWFTVDAAHQCEPSPQRTPVIYQAGASDRGTTFAARHAEVVFVTLNSAKRGAETVARLRRRAEEHGRGPDALRILQGMPVLLGRTDEEARERAEQFTALSSPGGLLAKWCGWVGVDLAAHPDDTPIAEILTEDGRSVVGFLASAAPDRAWTVGDVRDFIATPRRPHRFDRLMLFGTPEQVADRMEEYVEVAGVDGFNLFPCPPSSGIDDICDLLVPELQRRGLFRKAYDPAETTLRERYFGAGRRDYLGASER
ncbi:NtaA/DmoA family FMN-dependent monooxygenase [Luedemannella helvata]|uniref:LLM class flavin-dependent oxidoreductase n=1 Tax=Luedemannella helvata TaxID=349315 RepID=A0ABN2KV30_9ACTN